ncbi:MAG: hypothetical protein U5O39_19035 [Gammaproteobacteria bacterium]|nr:hypothetical protein [Gammaproteobacteria bacterium]
MTLTDSRQANFAEIDMPAGALIQTNAATGNTLFNDTELSLNSAELRGTNIVFSDFTALE